MGIVRDKPRTDKKVAEELADRSNITILEADTTNYDQLKVCMHLVPIYGGAVKLTEVLLCSRKLPKMRPRS